MNKKRYISSALSDAVFLGIFISLVIFAETQTRFFDSLFERFYILTTWQINKFGFAVFTVTLSAALFSYRRWKEMQSEVVKIRKAEESLLEAEMRSKALLSTIPNITLRIRKDGTFLAINNSDSSSSLFSKKILGATVGELFPSHIAELYLQAIHNALRTNDVQSFSFVISEHRYEARIVAGGTHEVIALIRDIRGTEEISQALAQSETRFKEVVESLSEGLVITDIDDRVLYMNRRMENLCGWKLSEVEGVPAYQCLFPKERWESQFQRNKNRLEGVAARYEEQMMRKDGSLFWAEVYGNPYRDTLGNIKGTIGTIMDITEQKWNEKVQSALYQITKLAALDLEMKEFFKRIHEIIGGLMYAKNFYVALYDSASDVISFPYFVDEVDTPPAPRKFSNGLTELVLTTKKILHSPHSTKSEIESHEQYGFGTEAIDWLGVPLQSGENTFGVLTVQSYTPEIVFGEKESEILVFVSQNIAAAIQQKSEKERFRAIWEHSADGMRVTDKNGRIIMVNAAYCTMVEKTSEELIGQLYAVVYKNEEHEIQPGIDEYKQHFASNNIAAKSNSDITLWNGKEMQIEFSTSYITFGVNERMLLSIFRDSTERKRLEDQLQHAQKMDSIGVLAGGIAHDFNNVLAMILGASEIIKSRAKENSEILKFANMIKHAAERGSGIAKQLLMFARSEKGIMRPLSLSMITTDVCKLLEHSMPKSISLQTEFTAHNDVLLGDGDQLNQVLINLAVNARDAMEEKGVQGILRFTVSNVSGASIAKKFSEALPQQYVVLQVIDSGTGIEENILERMYEPFFSTKERGKGTGLGLSIVHGIVKNHRGFIFVESTVGTGTTFTLYFPTTFAFIQEKPNNKTTLHQTAVTKTNGYILVVDDEAPLVDMVKNILESDGYRVLTAYNGNEALAQIEKHPSEISLIISDLGMPEMDGKRLLKEIRLKNITVDVIFMTGYFDHGSKAELIEFGAKDVLLKPFTLESITAAVSHALATDQV